MKKINYIQILLLFILVSCSSQESTQITPFDTQQQDTSVPAYPAQGYPANLGVFEATAYPPNYQPMGDSIAYPMITPTKNPLMTGPDFEIDEPVVEGDTTVTGYGPANVPIILIDATEMGEILSSTTIGEDGKFVFSLEKPLIAKHSIALQIGDLTSTDFDYADFIYSEDYIDRPLIGILFDIASVAEK